MKVALLLAAALPAIVAGKFLGHLSALHGFGAMLAVLGAVYLSACLAARKTKARQP